MSDTCSPYEVFRHIVVTGATAKWTRLMVAERLELSPDAMFDLHLASPICCDLAAQTKMKYKSLGKLITRVYKFGRSLASTAIRKLIALQYVTIHG